MSWKRWLPIGAAVAIAALVGGPFVYINFVRAEAPPPLTASGDVPATADASASGATDGTWVVADGSRVGYRVDEILFGQNATAVGRTDEIEGTLEVSGTRITSATFTVDMTSVQSDEDRRDNQFNGRIMDTSRCPTATFELTEPIAFEAAPAEDTDVTRTVAGELSLRGATKTVELEVTGRRLGGTLRVSGSVPITFENWGIPNPSFGAVTTEDHGLLEFALVLTKA